MKIIHKKNTITSNPLNLGWHILNSNGVDIYKEVYIDTYFTCKASEYLISNANITNYQLELLYNNMHDGQFKPVFWTIDAEVTGCLPTFSELEDWNNRNKELILSSGKQVTIPSVEIVKGDTVATIIKKMKIKDIFIKKENIL